MKKYKKYLLLTMALFLLLGMPIKIKAASANVSLTASSSQIVVGNYITYTVKISSTAYLGSYVYKFSYDTSKLTLISGTLNGAPVFTGSEKSKTYTFRFRAKASGSAKVSFNIYDAIDWDGKNLTVNTTTSRTTSIITQSQLEDSYSKNNYLSSLSINGYNLTPKFNKNTTTYSLTVENDIKEINIKASKEDSKASISKTGVFPVSEGANKIEIKVTAQNGNTKTYTINVTVKELSPIVVKVNQEEYNVVRKKELIEAPNSTYSSVNIKINNEDVPAFINETTKTTLVGLKNKEGIIALYKYDNEKNKYEIYKELKFNSLIITEEIYLNELKDYIKTTVTIDNKEIAAYKKDISSPFSLIYGTNIETGEKNLYQYDEKEHSIQRYNEKEINSIQNNYDKKQKQNTYIIIGLSALLVITYLTVLIMVIKNGKKKKRNNNKEITKELTENIKKITDNEELIVENINKENYTKNTVKKKKK